MLYRRLVYPIAAVIAFSLPLANAQTQAPFAYEVVPYSATCPTTGVVGCQAPGYVPAVFTYNGAASTIPNADLKNPANFGQSFPISILTSELNASIATALTVIPIASPASAVITRTDPTTGAELPVSSTLGPILTERAETIGKHRFFVGFANQDFHFTSLNGQSLHRLRLLDPGGQPTGLLSGTNQALTTYPATVGIGVDVHLGQNVAFFTYGLTDRVDVSVGLPIVHASISSQTSNTQIYAGDGFGGSSSSNPNCWCLDTLTPASAPGKNLNLNGLVQPGVLNSANKSSTGFGDMLVRAKGTLIRRRNLAFAVGADLRLPTGDEKNFLGTGATAIKPFLALSLYTTPLAHGIVFSPHFNVGWQFSGKSLLGGLLAPTQVTAGPPPFFAQPFNSTKDYLPDVFSWAVGSEIAFGSHNTVAFDILGNQIGLVHGIANVTSAQSQGFLPAVGCGATCQQVTVSGLVGAGRVSFGEYNGAFGYKAKIVSNLVFTFNLLVRFDNTGLTARTTPLFGLGYTF
ncbi:MAG TPA: hypothetical protein VEI26_10735 [Terriglobales bacterium]|nr:hypothetical protein [Terriglobales bacterium]